MVMFNKVVPFSALTARGRWKVEFFVPDRDGPRSAAYPMVPLAELMAERRDFLDPQRHPDRLFHYLGLEHVVPVTGDLADGYEPRIGRAVLSRSKVFRRGDVLYGRLRPALNKVYVAGGAVAEGICSGEFYVLTPYAGRILPHFARSLLASRYVQGVVVNMTGGSALPRLALDDLLRIEIPLPPLEIQCGYEDLIVARTARRRRLAAELRDGPARDLEAIVSALEAGTVPTFGRTPGPAEDGSEEILLPPLAPALRGRGVRG
jgi:hypothetical protein